MFSLRAWAFLSLTLISCLLSCNAHAATQVEFGRGPGNPGTVCIYDYSNARVCDPLFTLNDTTGIATWIAAGGGGGSGTVTSVGMTVPSILAVSGSPISVSGTFAVTLATETLNTVLAGPSSAGPSVPTFRALVAADIPMLPFTQLSGSATCAQLPALTGAITTTAGTCATSMATLNVAGGGTGATTLGSGLPLVGNGTSAISAGTKSGNTTGFLTFSGAMTAANCLHTDANGNVVITGSDCGAGGGGSGVVNSGTINQLAYYAAAGTTVSGETVLQAANFPALTGDLTTSAGSLVTTLATVDSTSGTYGITPGFIPGFTVNGKGLITASSQQTIAFSQITGALACSQAPAGTGDVGSPAGSCANTVNAIQGTSVAGTTGTGDVVFQTSPSIATPNISSPTITGAFTATGLVTNADLTHPATTVNGQTCTLGSTCTVTATITVPPVEHGGRLTIQSAVPVMVTSQSAQTTLYYAPYKSQFIAIYNGTNQLNYQFTSSNTDNVGLSLGTFGSGWAVSTVYDVFATLNAGVPVLCTGPAWATLNTRAAAGSLAIANGQYSNSNASAMTCRTSNAATISVPQYQATYLGTILTASDGTLKFVYGASASGGSAGVFNIWNYYNRVPISTFVFDTTTAYTYTTNTFRAANASTQNRVFFLVGQIEDTCTTWYQSFDTVAAAAGAFVITGIAFNSTTVDTSAGALWTPGTTSMRGVTSSHWMVLCNPIGSNFVQAVEEGDGTNANSFGTFGGNQLNFSYPM